MKTDKPGIDKRHAHTQSLCVSVCGVHMYIPVSFAMAAADAFAPSFSYLSATFLGVSVPLIAVGLLALGAAAAPAPFFFFPIWPSTQFARSDRLGKL